MATLIAQPERVQRARLRANFLTVAQQRLMIVLLGFVAIALLLIGKLSFYALFDSGDRQALATSDAPSRADITDRNNVPLARMIKAYSIRVNPSRIMGNKADVARQLHVIFPDTSAADFLAKLQGDRSTYIRQRALPEEVSAVNAIGEIAFEFPMEQERLYPQSALAAHLIGFSDRSGHGAMGVERAIDARLIAPESRGTPVALSIDSRVQAVLESELGSAITNLEARGGAGVILDANTGEVMALASFPTFNPNKITEASTEARRNAVTSNLYELGSTFKPLTVAAAIDAGVVNDMARRYDATAPLAVAGYQIRDSHPLNRWLTVPEMLVHSSNIVTARISDELGRENMEHMFRSLGFDRRAAIELDENSRPLWPQSWGRITTMTVGYGHGIAVTPMHLASAYAALVNGGIARPSTIFKLAPGTAPAGTRVFKASTSARMRQLLRLIVADGTGRKADAPGYRVGGKTGSAEKPSAGGYASHSVVATFAAAFPMDNPRYVVVIMVDEAKGNAFSSGQRTAAYTAAPVVKNVILRAAPMLGVYPDTTRDVDLSELSPLLGGTKE